MLSEIQDNQMLLEKVYRKLIRISFFIVAPLMLGLAAIAKPLFMILLGEEWLPAVLFFQILTLSMMLYPIHSFNLNILQVFGRSDLFLKLEIIKKIIITFAILLAFQFGVIGLIVSAVFTSFAALVVNMYYSSKLINYILKQVKDLLWTFVIAIFVSVLMYSVTIIIPYPSNILKIILASLFGVSAYIVINYYLKTSPLHQAILLFKTRHE